MMCGFLRAVVGDAMGFSPLSLEVMSGNSDGGDTFLLLAELQRFLLTQTLVSDIVPVQDDGCAEGATDVGDRPTISLLG